MKNEYLFSTVLLLALTTSCMNNKKEDVSVPQLEVEAPLETAANQCYQAIIGKDTITLTFMVNSVNQFEGELDYSYYQKDKSFGTLLGNVKGDTIFADYTFQSEGKTSVRELAFLKNDPNTFVEGHGEVVEVNGKAVFKDKSKIKFDGNIIYNKIECQE
ncbi:hypothetical protein FQU23_011450 [Flavobacterium sp. XN-5]|uniref:hypothetical protein n=1 Tax=Flavobacterium sp. XN-5 TaxID=2599390 RepID=UPI0011CA5E0C|nr:hypothetical protein [Flavobacterium sp. XN-5]NGY38124.1 hypothetical protein [Flavobacterium sp. XN-5]